jgi:hypothetical protein
MDCKLIRGGSFSAQASIRCTSVQNRNSTVEFVRHTPCRPPPGQAGSLDLRSINLGCARARAFPYQQLEGTGNKYPCGPSLGYDSTPVRCDPIAGYSCLARGEAFGPNNGYHADCTSIRDPFRALEIDYDFG